MVENTGLENRRRFIPTVGSNPTPSANSVKHVIDLQRIQSSIVSTSPPISPPMFRRVLRVLVTAYEKPRGHIIELQAAAPTCR